MSDYIKKEDAIKAIVEWKRKLMNDYIKRKHAIQIVWCYVDDRDAIDELEELPAADVRDDVTAHKVVGGGERDGSTCWFECDNCGLAVDIGDVFCKHCGARFVP